MGRSQRLTPRRLPLAGLVGGACLVAQTAMSQIVLSDLPWDQDALEPYMSAEVRSGRKREINDDDDDAVERNAMLRVATENENDGTRRLLIILSDPFATSECVPICIYTVWVTRHTSKYNTSSART